MDHVSLPDLDNLDRDALGSLVRGHQEELASLIAAHDDEIRRVLKPNSIHTDRLSLIKLMSYAREANASSI